MCRVVPGVDQLGLIGDYKCLESTAIDYGGSPAEDTHHPIYVTPSGSSWVNSLSFCLTLTMSLSSDFFRLS